MSAGAVVDTVVIRPIATPDVPAVVDLITVVLAEFGLTFGHGSSTDAAVRALPGSFTDRGGAFWVAESSGGAILACGGVMPLDPERWEVQKMYASPAARGLGLGRRLLDHCEAAARAGGAKMLVLDTTNLMSRAHRLYEQAGFVRDDAQIRGSRCSMGFRKDLDAG